MALGEVLKSRLWQGIPNGDTFDMQTALFQPVGGMGRIGEAFGRELGSLIRYNSKVVDIVQDATGVTATYVDSRTLADKQTVRADWCLCTIPLPVLAQIPMNVGANLAAAIGAVPYASAIKVGLQFKRRFWEEDEQIYGGITYTDLPITNIGYPNTGFFSGGKGVLLGAYIWGLNAMEFTAMSPPERVQRTLDYGSQIHPQYRQEFDNGIAVAWHRSPFTMGCFGMWSTEARARHYDNLCQIDGRIALAGEHASFLGGWQEGRGDIVHGCPLAVASARGGAGSERMSGMKLVRLNRALAALPLLMLIASAAGVRADDSSFTSTDGVGNMNGEQIYEHICQGCHMAGGQGAVGAGYYPKLAGDKKLVSWEYAAITVLNGRNGMPPFGLPSAAAQETRAVQLSDAQVADVVNFVRSHFDNKYRANVTGRQVQALPHPLSIAMPD